MITRDGSRIIVSGGLTIATVRGFFDVGLQVKSGQEVIVDLSSVGEVDSSAVSLLLAWLREAQLAGGRLSFVNASVNLKSLAQMYGVAEILSISVDPASQD